MKQRFLFRGIIACLAIIIFAPLHQVNAWHSTGHMSIAAMAYRDLPDAMKAHYTALLEQHPAYAMWSQEYSRLSVEIELGEYLFMRASVWPDEIRRTDSPYDHPTWHYTNYPVIAPDFPIRDTLTPENDVLYAIAFNKTTVMDATAPAQDQAAALSWLLHIIGDVHQPLHSVAFVSDVYPNGDRGGNDFFVMPAEDHESINLHAYWDGLLGSNGDVREARNRATLLWKTYSPTILREMNPSLSAQDWAMEGRSVAIEYVYLKGTLNGVDRDHLEEAEVLPETYATRAKVIAQHRAILASYRMARILEEIGS